MLLVLASNIIPPEVVLHKIRLHLYEHPMYTMQDFCTNWNDWQNVFKINVLTFFYISKYNYT